MTSFRTWLTNLVSARSRRRAEASSLPPGPTTNRLLLTIQFVRDPMGYARRAHERYGDIFHLRLIGAPPLVYVANPALARRVFATDRDIGQAGVTRQGFLQRMVGDNSILVLDGDEWLRQRKLVGSAFHTRYLKQYTKEIAQIAAEEIDTWPDGEEFELRPRTQKVALDVLLRLVFGIDDVARVAKLRETLPAMVNGAARMETTAFVLSRAKWSGIERMARSIPGSAAKQFFNARDEVDALIYEHIARRRSEPGLEDRVDIMSQLIRAKDSDGKGMTDVELRDALMTLLEAGYETTAAAMAWVFERLVHNPEILDRLTKAVDDGDEKYLEAVLKETLRTRPILAMVARRLTGELELDGYRVPAGWWVGPLIPLLHQRTAEFPEPDEFRPERFLDENEDTRAAWHPFGGGRRHCLGAQFAMLEMKAVVPEVLARRKMRAPDHAEPEKQRFSHVLILPDRECTIVAERRVPAGAPA